MPAPSSCISTSILSCSDRSKAEADEEGRDSDPEAPLSVASSSTGFLTPVVLAVWKAECWVVKGSAPWKGGLRMVGVEREPPGRDCALELGPGVWFVDDMGLTLVAELVTVIAF